MQDRSESKFIDQVKETIQRVLNEYDDSESKVDIQSVNPAERQNLGIARHVNTRLQALDRNRDCRSCWLQKAHCVCQECPPIRKLPSNVGRIFLVMHHKEIGLVVDTAKLILKAFPHRCRLVVGGIGSTYQDSMAELNSAMGLDANGKPQLLQNTPGKNKCLVLFPSEDARTFEELDNEYNNKETSQDDEQAYTTNDQNDNTWDLIVIDGTWSQARKLHQRHIPPAADGGPPRVQLSQEALTFLTQQHETTKLNESENNSTALPKRGLQLRRHPVKWREISTLEATRLLLGDMASGSNHSTQNPWDALADYQLVADSAARKQLGPPR